MFGWCGFLWGLRGIIFNSGPFLILLITYVGFISVGEDSYLSKSAIPFKCIIH